ncbi:MAG: radical SAM protein, partial [Clostridia bacterium]|nr:radical SAM protein [Clostridia bacterium]
MIDRACISLNHRCNLRCRYCHFAGKEEGVDNAEYEFSPDEAEKVAENIANYCSLNDIRGFKLGIVGSGEPLLSFPAIVSIVEKVRKVGGGAIKMYTITNGVCLTGEMIDCFYRNRDLIDVNFSLDGNEKVHNCLR